MFALGATLYSLLTGRPPFQAASVIETLDLVRTREPAPSRTLVPGLPRDLETIALTCLRKDPRRRYASASALADDLQRWLDGFPIRARPVSKLEHASRWCRRRPAFASLLAVLAFTVASSLVGLLTLWRHSETERGRAENALARAIESDKATSGAVRDLVGLLAMTVDAPQMLASERFESFACCTRSHGEAAPDRGFAASNLVAICDLERQLADDLRRRGNYAESRALLMDSLELLEGRRRGADDPDVDEAYAQALMQLGWIAHNQERFDEALVCFQRAEEVLKVWSTTRRHLEVILSIDETRRVIAWLLGRSGLEEPRRRLLESHIRMLERLSEHAGGDPAIGLLAVLVRSDLAPDHNATAKLGAAIQRFPANRRRSERFEWRVADWIAADVQPYPSGPDSTGEPKGRLDPDAHAHAVIQALESRCEALAFTPRCFPPRPSMWLALPPIEVRSNERLAAWTMPARTPHVSPPSRRCWHEEIPTRRRSTCCGVKPSSRNRKTPGKSRITPRSRRRSKGTGRSLYRVTSRPPEHGRAPEGRRSSGQVDRSGLRATFIAVSSRLWRTSGPT